MVSGMLHMNMYLHGYQTIPITDFHLTALVNSAIIQQHLAQPVFSVATEGKHKCMMTMVWIPLYSDLSLGTCMMTTGNTIKHQSTFGDIIP